MHAWSIADYTDMFGSFIRVETNRMGAEIDCKMYDSYPVYFSSDCFMPVGKHGMADIGYTGDQDLDVRFKRNERTAWKYRSVFNTKIGKQIMAIYCGFGYLINRYGIFLGR